MNLLNKVKNLFFRDPQQGDSAADDVARPQRPQGTDGTVPGPSSAAPKRPRSSGPSPSKPVVTGGPRQQREPVLRDASYAGNGGVQGLDWYAASQVQDQHGDFANEFLDADAGGAKDAGSGGQQAKRGAHKAPSKASVPAGTNGKAARQQQHQQHLSVKAVQGGTVVLEPVT